jgi:hypothetical protein
MEPKSKTEKYLEDNMDMIFGTECINGSFDIELRNKLENIIIVKDVIDSTHILCEKNNE